MMKIYEIRTAVNLFYQRFQGIINIIAKFVLSMITFILVNNAIGYDARFKALPVVMLLAILCAFTPGAVLVLMVMVVSLAHVYYASKFLAIIAAVLFIILYCLFYRFVPQYGFAVIALPVCMNIGIPYVVPIIMGLFTPPVSFLAVVCGTAIYYIFNIIGAETLSSADTINDALPLYTRVVETLVANKEMYASIVVFSIVIIVVYVVRRLRIKYAFEISIAAGMMVSIVGFMAVFTKLNVEASVMEMIFKNILCALITFVIYFFTRALDYTAVENVQFEDDDYYYYVKAVPKINISVPKMNVKRITSEYYSEDEDEKSSDEYGSDSAEHRKISIIESANARKQAREVYKEGDVDFTVDTTGIDIEAESTGEK